jgi:putative sterol carrier protein
MPLVFQRGQAKDMDAVYHFTFTGAEPATATVTIRHGTVVVEPGLCHTPTCSITADSATWLAFLRKEKNIVWAIVTRRVKVRGGIRWLKAFGKCFPS